MPHLGGGTGSHAIVIGGSMVGSVVAAVLADRFTRVTILERDWVPKRPGSRAGVPQSRHVHALLARGAAELDRLFPGFLKEMVEDGAEMIDAGRDLVWLTPAGWGVPFNSGLSLCCATRDLIEWQTRRRALALPNVTLVDATSVTGLLTDESGSRITGVRYRDRRYDIQTPAAELQADLVVDASGRGSQLPEWLQAIGLTPPREEIIDAGMACASRLYALSPRALLPWRAVYVQAASLDQGSGRSELGRKERPQPLKGGILLPVEERRWHLTLFGYGDAAPPMNERGFREFVDGLRSSILADLVQKATPLSPIVGHRRTENRWRRFDEMSDWPDGLIAAGDSVCCFDPVHLQGMTTGILGALAIGDGLAAESNGITGGPAGFARRVQQQIVDVVRPAWDLATGQDLRLASPSGGPPRTRDRLWLGYFDRVVAASTADAKVRARLLAVINMVDGPDTLFRPDVIARLAWHACGLNGTREPLWTERPPKQANAAHAAERRTIDTSAA